MAKSKDWLHKEYDLEGWLLKRFLFEDEWEFIIFVSWGLLVSVFLTTLV